MIRETLIVLRSNPGHAFDTVVTEVGSTEFQFS
jgi:hypothetical protein